MKKSILTIFLLLPFLSFSQSTLDLSKVKGASKAYLMKRLNNPSSYQPSSWSKLEKTYSIFSESKEGKKYDDTVEYYREAKHKAMMMAHSAKLKNILNYDRDSTYLYYHTLERTIDSAFKSVSSKKDKLENNFKGTFDGYRIEHSFRARNKFNALVLNNWYFVLNKAFKVISAGDSDALEDERRKLQAEIDELTNKNN